LRTQCSPMLPLKSILLQSSLLCQNISSSLTFW
jgi:hypothetical protein